MPCRWDAPDGSHAVFVECGTVEALRAQAIQAFLSLPRRGAEVGGLLLGEIDSSNPRVVSVTGFEDIPCEHRYGPTYVLSDGDRRRLAEAVERPGRPERVVGFYRSYTGREPALDAADEDLIRTFFRDTRYAFLLIKPVSTDECSAAFLFWNRSELPEAPLHPPFRLDPDYMRIGEITPASAPATEASHEAEHLEPEPPADLAPVRAALAPDPAPEVALPAPEMPMPSFAATRWRHDDGDEEERASTRPRRGRPVWLLLVACILIGAGGAFVYELWKLAREPRWTALHLDALQTPAGLQLNWDRSAPAVLRARSGALVVQDGPARQTIDLASGAIRAGQYAYRPQHPDVSFRLELYDGPLAYSGDSLRLLSLAPSPRAPASAGTPPPPSAPASSVRAASPRTGTAEREEPASAITPPAILHEVHPGLSSGILSRLNTRVVVPVEVSVSASGRVTHAVAESGEGSLYGYLAARAERAALLWRFSPARSRSGKRVAGKKTIYFVFAKS